MSAVVRGPLGHLGRIKADVERLGGAGGVAALVVLGFLFAAEVALPRLVSRLPGLSIDLLRAGVGLVAVRQVGHAGHQLTTRGASLLL